MSDVADTEDRCTRSARFNINLCSTFMAGKFVFTANLMADKKQDEKCCASVCTHSPPYTIIWETVGNEVEIQCEVSRKKMFTIFEQK